MRRTILEQFLRDDRPTWQRWAMVVVGFLLLLLAPLIAHAQGGGPDTLQIVWTATGDDGAIGTAASYQIRVSTAPITLANWGAANVVGPAPLPLPSGSRQGFTVRGLSSDTTYYIAMIAADEAGNTSTLSNVLRWDWSADASAPPVPLGVRASMAGADVQLTWDAVAASDLDGYSVYRATSAGGPYVRLNATLVTPSQYRDTSAPANPSGLWYRVSASDLSGNESAQSSASQVQLAAPPGAWSLSPVYPNPSSASQPVCIPLATPASGAGNAAVDIVNAGGNRVRHIEILSAATCAGGQGVMWDGANDAGRGVAPGVYRAWLIAGDTRMSVKLVRVP
jgi:hypothetical protein